MFCKINQVLTWKICSVAVESDSWCIIPTSFTMRKFSQKYKDPVKQAEYAYSLIESEVK